jgi:mediator of RNA polymerase II transcription subunit 12
MIIADEDGRRACALRYGNFLLHVDEHLPSGMDEQVLQWFLGPGKSEVIALGNDAWDIMTIVIHYLSVHGALKTSTILRGLVYPAWQLTSTASTEQFPEVYLRGANNLFELLVLREQGATEGTPPSDLLDIQRIRTLRQDVYREPHFSLLVASIPTLISIERNDIIAEDLRLASMTLRYALCELDDFRQATHRNLDAVRDAFERPLQEGGIQDDLGDAMVDALRLVLRESNNSLWSFVGLFQLLTSFARPSRLAGPYLLIEPMATWGNGYLVSIHATSDREANFPRANTSSRQ